MLRKSSFRLNLKLNFIIVWHLIFLSYQAGGRAHFRLREYLVRVTLVVLLAQTDEFQDFGVELLYRT